MKYREEKADLLKVPQGWWLAHCISADFALGAGVAKQINEAFNMREMLKEEVNNQFSFDGIVLPGACIPIGNVYNLVTKEKYYHKPTLGTLELSLRQVRRHAVAHKVKKIAMPKIGCGLDRLNWDDVKPLIQEIFKDTDIEIMVCYL